MTTHEERIAELVKALRSGEYRQGWDALRQADSYCFSGVACDVSRLGEWDGSEDGYEWSYRIKGSLSNNTLSLPLEVMNYYGWSDPDAKLTVTQRFGDSTDLVDLNDNGFSFDEIADLIEAGLVEMADRN